MARKKQDDVSDEAVSENEDVFSQSEDDDEVMTPKARLPAVDEKDSDEEELERLVLGNRAGFRANLFKDDGSFEDGNLLQDLQLEEAAVTKEAGLEDVDDSALFFIDTAAQPQGESQLVKAKTAAVTGRTTDGDAPAWYDSDDERLSISLAGHSRLRKLRETEADDVVSGEEYSRRLRQQYLRLNPLPAWARDSNRAQTKRRRSSASSASSVDSDEASDDGSDLSALPLESFLRDVRQMAGAGPRKKRKLRPEVIDIQRTRDIPDSHKGPVGSLSFHPQYPVLLSSSTSSILHLHHIAPTAHPTPNPQLTSVQIKHTPIQRSAFLDPEGQEIILAGRRRYFHSWNISTGLVKKITRIQGHRLEQKTMERFRLSPCGRWMALIASSRKGGGMLNILNVKSMQWVAQARIDSRGGIADFSWWSDGEGVTILGRDGAVSEWSMASKRTVGTWRDEGSIGGTVMALGGHHGPDAIGGDRWVALGSNSGVLNIYDRNDLIASASKGGEINPLPEPKRRFEQLTTPITAVTFSPDGQLLAFASQHKKDAFRLAHLPTCTIYRNWPTEQTPLGRITAVAFGRQSDLLAVGNDTGKIRLWEIRN